MYFPVFRFLRAGQTLLCLLFAFSLWIPQAADSNAWPDASAGSRKLAFHPLAGGQQSTEVNPAGYVVRNAGIHAIVMRERLLLEPFSAPNAPPLSLVWEAAQPSRDEGGTGEALDELSFNDLYPGVSIRYYGVTNKQGATRLKYDLELEPGADPSVIVFRVDGADWLHLDGQGRLVVGHGGMEVTKHQPVTFQDTPLGRKPVECRYHLLPENRVSFHLGEYDQRLALVIDPILEAATLFGDGRDFFGSPLLDAAAGPDGSIYLLGVRSQSLRLPGDPNGPRLLAGAAPRYFLTRISQDFSHVIFTSSFDLGFDYLTWEVDRFHLVVAPDGSAYIAVPTLEASRSLDLTTGPHGFGPLGEIHKVYKTLVMRISADGERLIFRTVVGCGGGIATTGIAHHPRGLAMTGIAICDQFPISPGAWHIDKAPGVPHARRYFISILSEDGQSLPYSTTIKRENIPPGSLPPSIPGPYLHSDQPVQVAVDDQGRLLLANFTSDELFSWPGGGPLQTARYPWEGTIVRLNQEGSEPECGVFVGVEHSMVHRFTPTKDGGVLAAVRSFKLRDQAFVRYSPCFQSVEREEGIPGLGFWESQIHFAPDGEVSVTSKNLPLESGWLEISPDAPFRESNRRMGGYLNMTDADAKRTRYSTYLPAWQGSWAKTVWAKDGKAVIVTASSRRDLAPVNLPLLVTDNTSERFSGVYLARFDFHHPANCSLTLNPEDQVAEPLQTEVTVSLRTGRECAWLADGGYTSDAGPMAKPNWGFGSATIRLPLRENFDADRAPVTMLWANEAVATIQQPEASCDMISAMPASLRFPAEGGSATVTLRVPMSCEWGVTLPAPWATVVGNEGEDADRLWFSSRTFRVTVPSHAYEDRSTFLTLAGLRIPIEQQGGACRAEVTPTGLSFPAGGGEASLQVTVSGTNCPVPVLHSARIGVEISSLAGGTAVSVRVPANRANTARDEWLEVAGKRVSITQMPGQCQASVTPLQVNVSAGGGKVLLTGSASGPDCEWNLTFDQPWVRRRGWDSTPEEGSGTLGVEIRHNRDTATRTATVRMLGQTVRIVQEGARTTSQLLVSSMIPFKANGILYPNGSTLEVAAGTAVTLEAPVEWQTSEAILFAPTGWDESMQLTRTYIAGSSSRAVQLKGEQYARADLEVGGNHPGDGTRIEMLPALPWDRRDRADGIYLNSLRPTRLRAIPGNKSRFVRWRNLHGGESPTVETQISGGASLALFEPLEMQANVQWTPMRQRLISDVPFPVSAGWFTLHTRGEVPLRPIRSTAHCDGLSMSPLVSSIEGQSTPFRIIVIAQGAPGIPMGSSYSCSVRLEFESSSAPDVLLPVTYARGTRSPVEARAQPAAVVDAASFRPGTLPSGGIASLFGIQLVQEAAPVAGLPLPLKLSDLTVRIRIADRYTVPALRLFYASPQQVNLLLPEVTEDADAMLLVEREGDLPAELPIRLSRSRPSLFAANQDGRGPAAGHSLRARLDGTQVETPLAHCPGMPAPCMHAQVDFGGESDEVFLVLYGLGLPDSRNATAPEVTIGDAPAAVTYSGPQGTYFGLSQINVKIPKSLRGRGVLPVAVHVNGVPSNAVEVRF